MALDLQEDFERLSTRPGPNGHKVKYNAQDGADRECLYGGGYHRRSEQTGESGLHEAARLTARRSSVEMHDEMRDDRPTPPINVPSLQADHGDSRAFNGRLDESFGYDDASLDGTGSSSKRTSLSFDPLVKLDSGDQIPLEMPIPREPLPKITVPSNPRGRSLIEELHKARERDRDVSRAHSETDRQDYDTDTGERIESSRSRRDGRYLPNQERWPFLRKTVDELAIESRRPREGSMTSRTTVSTTNDEILTPNSTALEPVMSPISIPSPLARSDWSAPALSSPRELSASKRSKSFQDRKSSRRSGTRRSNSSMSPASAFLSKYMGPPEPTPDPDAEGQEVGDYVMGREIGFGGFSIIREAYTFYGSERIQRAVKIVRRQVHGKEESENESLQAEFEHEVSLWRCLHHKHICPLLAVYISDFATFAFMPMNVGGTLFDVVRSHRDGIPPHLARRYACQVASALRYLHEDMRIVHRDIKLENCLLDSSGPDADEGGRVLLCDFGLADYMTGAPNPPSSAPNSLSPSPDTIDERPEQAGNGDTPSTHAHTQPPLSPAPHPPPPPSSIKGQLQPDAGNGPRNSTSPNHNFGPSDTSTNLAGSLPYAAPELLASGRGLIDPCIDVWAYGVLVYAMVAGKLPFSHSFAPRVRMMIIGGEFDRGKLKELEEGGTGWKGLREVVEGCLQREPRYRPDIRWVLESGWLEEEREDDEDEDRSWS